MVGYFDNTKAYKPMTSFIYGNMVLFLASANKCAQTKHKQVHSGSRGLHSGSRGLHRVIKSGHIVLHLTENEV